MKEKLLSRYKWWALGWTALLIIAFLFTPSVANVNKSSTIPRNYQSTKATKLQNQWGSKENKTTSLIVVFNNQHHRLTSKQNRAINQTITRLKQKKQQYQIKDMTDAKDTPLVKSQLISKDKTTQIVEISVQKTKQHDIKKIKQELTKAIKTPGVRSYLTGSDILDQDFSNSTEKGVKKTEIIAAIFIFVVLLLVFKSPITPIFSLITVGVAGLISISTVDTLVKYLGFPYSDFTEVFIIIVLFGIGTDYNILLYNEFKAGLSAGLTKKEATKSALQVGGRTIIYSGVSVLIGMTTLFFAKFSLYRSAAGIAVGVAILLLVLLTLNPFFMGTIGEKIFWPIKHFEGEKQSRLWQGLAKYSLLRPIITIVVVLAFLVPLAVQSQGLLNYDDVDEVSSQVPSKIGFNLIQQHFSKGMSEPTTIFLNSRHQLINEKYLKLIDQLTNQLKNVAGIKTVLSASQPAGKVIKNLYLKKQLTDVTQGLTQAKVGLSKISGGLSSAKNQIDGVNIKGEVASTQQLASGSQQVATGTSQLSDGIKELTSAVTTLHDQLNSGMNNSEQAQLQKLVQSLPELNHAISQLNQQVTNSSSSSESTTKNSLTQIGNAANDIQQQLTAVDAAMGKLTANTVLGTQLVAKLQSAGVKLTTEQRQKIIQIINQNQQQQQQALSSLNGALTESLTKIGNDTQSIGNSTNSLAAQLTTLQQSSASLQQAVSQLASSSAQILPAAASTITQLNSNLGQLSSSTAQLATAMDTLNNQTGQLTTGANQVAAGNQKLVQSLTGLPAAVQALSAGLGSATNGIGQVNQGNQASNNYLQGLQKSTAGKTYYLPAKKLHSKAFKPILDTYFSDNKRMTQLTVILKADPNSQAAIQTLAKIQQLVTGSLKGTSLNHAEVVLGGSTSQTRDLKQVAAQDFKRTALLMLVGILVALMFVTRSLIQSLTIEAMLVIIYYSALNIVHWFSQIVLKTSMLTWNTPFFAFIMLVALGVDYSIFLVIKFREGLHEPISIDAKVLRATAIIGTVVISAGIILSGTFAALIPSGVTTLIQVALVVITGIFLLVILIPIVMPAVMKITYPTPSSKINDQSYK
ncbi:MMPL family transporter [Liquorilactobacillus vini]|uniref:Membrane transport protein MMPL domain-containing protein n=1 Tax=Liquorilactobacillus vini DSM 20605 TaxID=1133569 RepID=A0A0R2CCN7_9LACO|nr:MMPL family transporter [Liquorilactobacillus vini]KRM88850.1 hypothetical protein FD21_GL000638 [Liquorilactobacillus vini DSM 20605]